MRHQITRIRRETRQRELTVARIEPLGPRMLRLHFTSADLADFESSGFDDHVKLFFPTGEPLAEGERPPMRDFTPRRFDPVAGTIAIDFALHEAGPAMDWVRSARVGDTLRIGGPRGSAVIPDDFDWYWLIGDETALPAIGRRIEELREDVPVTSVVIADEGTSQAFETGAAWHGHWLVREANGDDGAALIAALADLPLPSGDGFVWIAAEAGAARKVRAYLTDERGHPREWSKAAGYWQRGTADSHVKIED